MARMIETAIEGTGNDAVVIFRVAGERDLRLPVADLAPEVMTRAMIHGLVQKVSDAAAIPRDVNTGRSATSEEKRAAMATVVETLLGGEWNRRAPAGATSEALTVRAIARVKQCTVDVARAAWDRLSAEEKKALRANARILAAVAEIRAEDGGPAGDDVLDSLL